MTFIEPPSVYIVVYLHWLVWITKSLAQMAKHSAEDVDFKIAFPLKVFCIGRGVFIQIIEVIHEGLLSCLEIH